MILPVAGMAAEAKDLKSTMARGQPRELGWLSSRALGEGAPRVAQRESRNQGEGMTTNVVVATYHGVVLGCDSLSSMVERAYFPFRSPNAVARNPDGTPMRDAQGRPLVALSDENFIQTPTTVVGGVQKMFVLYQDKDTDNVERSVAATTAGLGTLNGVVIAELAERFRRKCFADQKDYSSAEQVVNDFIDYLRPLWQQEVGYDPTKGDDFYLTEDLMFLVSGYCPDDEYIKVYEVSIAAPPSGKATEQFANAPHCSAAWAGQTSSIESLIMGSNYNARWPVHQAFSKALEVQRDTLVASVIEQLKANGVDVPEGIQLDVRAELPTGLPWNAGAPQFNWQNLPVQSAVDLVSTLVNAESAIQKFAMGIPTVGGRTRLGLMRRGIPFAFLNEPEIIHQHVGYNHDA